MKPYHHHDPILDKGKAVPKPYNPGDGKGWSGFGGTIPASRINSSPNSRVRRSKKERILMRDRDLVKKGLIYHTLRSRKRVRRAIAD